MKRLCFLLFCLLITAPLFATPRADVTATVAGNAVVFAWDPNTEPDLAGYNVYQGTHTGGPYTKIGSVGVMATPTYADTNSAPHDETGYACHVSLDNATWSTPYQVGAGVTTMTAAQAYGAPLVGSTLYYFQCKAVGDGGKTTNDSAYTASFSFTTGAVRYWVGGTGNTNATTHWSDSSGGAGGQSIPGAVDTAIWDANSGTGYTVTVDAAFSVGTFSYTGSASKLNYLTLAANVTATSAFTIAGGSAVNRPLVSSNTIGTARTITLTGATVSIANADFRDITMTPAQDISAGNNGGGTMAGDSGITFPAPLDIYFYKASGNANWSDSNWFLGSAGTGGAGRVPLIQDTAKFLNGFGAASMVLTQDMPRIGGKDFTGANNTPELTTSTGASVFGSSTFISAMILTESTQVYTFEGRGSYTITSAGLSRAKSFVLNAPGGTYTLQDAFVTTGYLGLINGTLTANNQNVTIGLFDHETAGTCVLNMGSGTWTLTGSLAIWYDRIAGMTINADTSTIVASYSGTNDKDFYGNGKTFHNLSFTGGTGNIVLIDANTFSGTLSDLNTSTHSITFPNVTTTVGGFARGSGTNVISLIRTGASGQFTLLKTGGGVVNLDYMSISNGVASPATTWYAGATPPSTDGGGNSGWVFTAAPAGTSKGGMLLLLGGRHGGPGDNSNQPPKKR
jgi:hypothetical protein